MDDALRAGLASALRALWALLGRPRLEPDGGEPGPPRDPRSEGGRRAPREVCCVWCGSGSEEDRALPPGHYDCPGCGASLFYLPVVTRGEVLTMDPPDSMPARVPGVER